MVLFAFLFADMDELRKSKKRFGYKHWFQNALGNGLIEHGIKLVTESLEKEAAASEAESRNVQLPTVTSLRPTVINRNVLQNVTNSPPKKKRSAGRPAKRSRGRNGGRPRSAVRRVDDGNGDRG